MPEARKSPRNRGSCHPIAESRIAAGLTQAQLAKMCGCSGKDISRYEHGVTTPRADRLAAISEALGIAPELIMSPWLKNLHVEVNTRPENEGQERTLSAILKTLDRDKEKI